MPSGGNKIEEIPEKEYIAVIFFQSFCKSKKINDIIYLVKHFTFKYVLFLSIYILIQVLINRCSEIAA